jgi:radical SAM/Cys-rich protein
MKSAPQIKPQKRQFPCLNKAQIDTVQFNMGRLCNQACLHCHVDSSPKRSGSGENASAALVDQVIDLLRSDEHFKVLDLTGGAPELNPNFRRLVRQAGALNRGVFVRHNLTVQFVEGQHDLPEFYAAQKVILFCSLPCYRSRNVDNQRGNGVFESSIKGLQALNAAGFGVPGSGLEMHLVYNPVGPTLPPDQAELEREYRAELEQEFGVEFSRLITIANQPIHRYREQLHRMGKLTEYLDLLEANFNPDTLPALMCRTAISVRWDGLLFDCDFNLVQELPMAGPEGENLKLDHILEGGILPDGISPSQYLAGRNIVVDQHCFACTAGSGSSCGGALA